MVEVACLWSHKAGGSARDYEDACRWRLRRSPGEPERWVLRAAIADGATESLLAQHWARLLVSYATGDAASKAGGGPAAAATLAAARWPDVVSSYVQRRKRRGRPIAWYEEPGLARGAHATLLTTTLIAGPERNGGGRWQAAALGDSCLFHVRDEALITAFPIADAADFGNRPHLLGSRAPDPELIGSRTAAAGGIWWMGDVFFLCTDAIAAWFLAEHAAERAPWDQLTSFRGGQETAFGAWVTEQREGGRMRNDDVTVVRIALT